MGKQTGPFFRTGTIGRVTYYQLFEGHYYLRAKSSLTRKRFFLDGAFEGSRKRSKEFGGAAALASRINRQLPRGKRGRGFMGKLIGQVHKALLAGGTPEEVTAMLLSTYGVAKREHRQEEKKEPLNVHPRQIAGPANATTNSPAEAGLLKASTYTYPHLYCDLAPIQAARNALCASVTVPFVTVPWVSNATISNVGLPATVR